MDTNRELSLEEAIRMLEAQVPEELKNVKPETRELTKEESSVNARINRALLRSGKSAV
jgi:hypothetical protein